MLDRLSRWQTPIVVGALCVLALATGVEGDWFTAAEYVLLAVVCWWLGDEEPTTGTRRMGRTLALAVAAVTAPVVLAIHVTDGSWWRAGLWALVAAGMLLTWGVRRSAVES